MIEQKVKQFIDSLNTMMREMNITIDFSDGSISHKNEFLGFLEDSRTQVAIVTDSGSVLYESEDQDFD